MNPQQPDAKPAPIPLKMATLPPAGDEGHDQPPC